MYIEKYYNKIKSKEIIVGKKIERLYEKLIDDIKNPKTFEVLQMDGKYKKETFIFDEAKAAEPIDFIQAFCRQSKAPFCGFPIKLLLWQKALLETVYGFINGETGERRYQEILLEVARKNGKSTLMSGLGCYHLAVNKGCEIICGANTRSQAEIIFQEARNMIEQSPLLNKRVRKRKYDLYNSAQYNLMKPVANNSNLDGLNVDVFLCDEIHEFKSYVMYDLVKGSMGTKTQPLIFMVTTNGFVRENFLDDKLDYANNVLDGITEDHTFLPVLYELDAKNQKEAEEEIKDKNNWYKTNPSLGVFRSFAEIDKLIKQSKGSKIELGKVLAKYFNLPQSATAGWLAFDQVVNPETFEMEDFRGCYCIGGVDLSEVGDLTSAALIFMKKNSDKIYVVSKSWMPGDLIEEKEIRDQVPYLKWVERGFIEESGDTKIDYDDVISWFKQMRADFDFFPRWIGYDSWNSNYWIKGMKDEGFEMVEVRQGYKTFTTPVNELEADFKAKRIVHNNNPVLVMSLLNTQIERDKNRNKRPVKGRNKRKRIDPTMALLDAYVVLLDNKEDFIKYL